MMRDIAIYCFWLYGIVIGAAVTGIAVYFVLCLFCDMLEPDDED